MKVFGIRSGLVSNRAEPLRIIHGKSIHSAIDRLTNRLISAMAKLWRLYGPLQCSHSVHAHNTPALIFLTFGKIAALNPVHQCRNNSCDRHIWRGNATSIVHFFLHHCYPKFIAGASGSAQNVVLLMFKRAHVDCWAFLQ